MSDNMDDDLGLDEGNFDDFEKKPGTLGSLWRENPGFKVGIIVVAAVVVFGAIFMMGGSKKPVDQSFVPAGSEVSSPPSTEASSPAYIDAVQEENQTRYEEAVRTGSSSLPTPINPPVGRLTMPDEEGNTEDPLQRWRKLQEERLERELQKTQSVKPEYADEEKRQKAVQALSALMTQQMQAILESKNEEKKGGYKSLTSISWLDDLKEKEEQKAQQEAAAAAPVIQSEDVILQPAGKVIYAQLLTEANSDVPGPVLAQIMAGPLAGSRVLGSFEVNDEYLTLTFNTVVVDDESLDMSGVALDPDTTLPGMATDVDHHYLKRVILPMAAAFVEGAASAISESGRTTVSIQGETVAESTEPADNKQEIASGIDEAGQKLGEIFDDMADETEVTVRIESGTPIGILFLEPVTRTEKVEQPPATTSSR